MFQATRQRLALWYTAVTAVLLLLFASGFYLYVRTTLVERVDDTLNHVVEIVERSLVIEPTVADSSGGVVGHRALVTVNRQSPPLYVNVEASFRDNARAVEDDHIDLEWFGPSGELLWSTLSEALPLPLRVNPSGETVRMSQETVFRQITQRIQVDGQVLGYLRVSHPWFEVTKPSRRLILDLALGTSMMVGAVAAIGWFLSGIAIAPVRDSYQQLKQFTADASHELRNPIAVIQTNAQVALSDPNPDVDSQQKQFQVIERLTRRLGRLVDDLLFLARQESGLLALAPASVDLAGLLAEVCEEQQVMALDRSIELRLDQGVDSSAQRDRPTYQVPQATPLNHSQDGIVVGDVSQLTRLFTNLICNAVQYTPDQGTVGIQIKPTRYQGAAWVQVTVQDTGIGMDAEALAHVFDRFYRADPARLRSGDQGTGLGCDRKAIVDTHRGHIYLASQPGQGTRVTVLLPRSQANSLSSQTITGN
ncbi:MAG: HAMP domain-containing histidine kinase [Leptolyngbyaceae cyanobacterium SM2_5_2]|nr:HAMP domain-containing histidine kinase [Leptolyngbyaceae cyanobacterium SM2_5_2]